MSWRTFLRSHADVIAGIDFFTVEVWTARGLVTHYVLFAVHHATRAVHSAGITTNPESAFMAQVARNLTALDDGFLNGIRYLILDRDTKSLGSPNSLPTLPPVKSSRPNASVVCCAAIVARRDVGAIRAGMGNKSAHRQKQATV